MAASAGVSLMMRKRRSPPPRLANLYLTTMTHIRLDHSIVQLVLLAALSTGGGSAVAQERSGLFKTMEGDVTLLRGGKSQPALPGGALREGDRIVTGRNSAVSVVLSDGTVVSVGPNSSVDITHYIFDPTTQNGSLLLNLLQGTVRMVTGIMGKTNPELIKLTTPTTVVGVRGTDFIVEAQP